MMKNTNMHILIFKKFIILKEGKIGYCLKKVDQYIPAPLWCFKCQKYKHHKGSCRWCSTCEKCGLKMLITWRKIVPRNQISRELSTFSRTCKGEKWKIIEVKYRWNITFLEARKIVETYMKDNTYTYVVKRMSPINNN